MNFKKGDGRTHHFALPVGAWSAGGKLFFAAKSVVDNDPTDNAAVIDKTFTDVNIVGIDHEYYDPEYVTWELNFLPEDLSKVTFSGGETKQEYMGEFQYVPAGGVPESFPADDKYIKVVVYADIKRGTA